jgi:hypothetical protein
MKVLCRVSRAISGVLLFILRWARQIVLRFSLIISARKAEV